MTLPESQEENQAYDYQAYGSSRVTVTILASEWGSSKGGLSSMNRELAIQLAKFPDVEITFILPQCNEEEKNIAHIHNINIVEAIQQPGFKELECLQFLPKHWQTDVVVSHGVKLGHQAQIIRDSRKCKWVHVVNTDPAEAGINISCSNMISKAEEKDSVEEELCQSADFVVGVGPKLSEAFRSYLRWCSKNQTVLDLKPRVSDNFIGIKQNPGERTHCHILVFGRDNAENFELKGVDISARAVATLHDTQLAFVGAPFGKHQEIVQRLLNCNTPSNRLKDEEDDRLVGHPSGKLHVEEDICICILNCLLNSKHLSLDEEAASSSGACSGDSASDDENIMLNQNEEATSNGVSLGDSASDDENLKPNQTMAFLSCGSTSTSSLNSLPPSPAFPFSVDGQSLFTPMNSPSEGLSVTKLKGNNQTQADNSDLEKRTYGKPLSENSLTVFKHSGLCLKLPEKPTQSSDSVKLSSYEEVLNAGEDSPELKEPNQIVTEFSKEEPLDNFSHGAQSVRASDHRESYVVHDRGHLTTHWHDRSNSFPQPEHSVAIIEPSGTFSKRSCATVSEEITAETLTNDCLRVALANLEDELAAARNQSHELREEVNELKEQLMQSNAEKQHLQAELGRYQFLEHKERRNEKLLLSVRASGSEQSRPCGASSSCALRSLDGRHGTPPLQEPSFLVQTRRLEISNSLSVEELKQMKFLAKSKVNSFRLAKIREGYELFEELEARVEYPCAYIRQLLEEIKRFDLSAKLGSPSHDNMKSGAADNSPQSMPSRDSTEDKEVQTGDKNESGFDHNSSVSLLSSGSSDVAESDMPVQSINAENVSLSSQGSLYVEEGTQFPSSPGDSILSKSSCSTTVSSSDSLTGSMQTTQAYHSTSNSQDSHDSSVNPQSVAATTENSSDSGFNPTTSKEEIVRSFQLLSTADDGSEKEDTVVARACASKSEDSEKRSVDLCNGAMQSEARASTVGAAASFTDSSACTDVTSQTGSNVVPWWQQRSFADNQISVSSVAAGAGTGTDAGPMPDWERLGARPKQSQVQGPPAKQVPREVIGPVADGLAGDFLARHSQDRALHQSLYQNGSDTSLFDDTPTQGASFVDGMVNAYETHKAKPFFGECQAASATDVYGRLGNPPLNVTSGGFERSNTDGGFSYNEHFSGSTGYLAGHLPVGSNLPFHSNYLSQNALNATNSYSLQSGFVHNPSKFAGVEPFGREPYVPLDGHLGLYSSVHGSEPFHSGMTGSSFAGSAWMGAVGTQPGHFTYGAQRYTGFSDNTSILTPEQDKSQTPQNTSITVGNQFRSATNSDYVLSASAENNLRIDIGNSGLPAPSSVSRSNGSGVDTSTTSWPPLNCASSNTLTVGSEVASQGAADGNADSLLERRHVDANSNSEGSMLNRDFGTDSVESTDNSLLALEQRVAEACALVERVIREREEREQFGREIERKEQMIREQRARERREREEREMQEAERWPQQQDAITPRSQWLCEHYQRYCRVRFPCCTQFYPCHRCHNNARACDNEEAKACHATHLKCSHCHHEQEIGEDSAKCRKCGGKMSAYFCSICKHFTSVDKNPYHCDKCGICRIHEDKSFHCEVCNVCLDKRLQGNHKCRPDSGHDECCICLEDAFSGCQILPCSHKVHRECAIAMIQNGIRTCPICRHPLYSPRE